VLREVAHFRQPNDIVFIRDENLRMTIHDTPSRRKMSPSEEYRGCRSTEVDLELREREVSLRDSLDLVDPAVQGMIGRMR
jgi:hypothetical protein